MAFMELDAAAGGRVSARADDVFPPAILGPAAKTNWPSVLADGERFQAVLTANYDGDVERAGSNWIRLR